MFGAASVVDTCVCLVTAFCSLATTARVWLQLWQMQDVSVLTMIATLAVSMKMFVNLSAFPSKATGFQMES